MQKLKQNYPTDRYEVRSEKAANKSSSVCRVKYKRSFSTSLFSKEAVGVFLKDPCRTVHASASRERREKTLFSLAWFQMSAPPWGFLGVPFRFKSSLALSLGLPNPWLYQGGVLSFLLGAQGCLCLGNANVPWAWLVVIRSSPASRLETG